MSLKGKRILITAGPTWVHIDNVRVISNIATGETGRLLAREAVKQGARVTLVAGPCAEYNSNKSTRLIRFRFFDELKGILKNELTDNKYDAVIHSAAVCDFKPGRKIRGKLSSDKSYSLKLLPAEKLINLIRRLTNNKAKLVMFKLEVGFSNRMLISTARQAGSKVGADLIVANRLNPYRAFIIDKKNNQIAVKSKQELAKKLIKFLSKA
jgi:phosphopantothenoylcysteine decarboxylase/phosphopantothenate--cysteine ligase